MKLSAYLISCFIICFSCGQTTNDYSSEKHGATIEATNAIDSSAYTSYKFDKPDELYTMPGSLTELSGMQHLSNNVIACTQDEKGIIYLFDRAKKAIISEVAWGKDGDYEGVAGNDQELYILESTGTIYKIRDFLETNTPRVETLNTGLSKPCDAEGLFLQHNKEKLLIACKEGERGIRSIWTFDPKAKQLSASPYMNLPEKVLEDHLITTGLDRVSLGMKKLLDVKGESGILAPSGIAIHPKTEDLYIVSANSKLLVVLNPEGKIKSLEELPSSLFTHPESITFTADGDLLIGNEGGAGVAPTILYFNYQQSPK